MPDIYQLESCIDAARARTAIAIPAAVAFMAMWIPMGSERGEDHELT